MPNFVQSDPAAVLPAGGPVQGTATPYYGTTVGDWDTIVIGGLTFAQTKITIDGTPGYKFDVKPAPGLDGARETPIGYEPANLVITIDLWNLDLMVAWSALIGTYKPKPSKTKPVPVTIDHPWLRMYGLARFYVVKTPIPKSSGPQAYEGAVHVLEYFDQPKPSGTQAPKQLAAPTIYAGQLPTSSEPNQSFETGSAEKPTPPDENNTGPT